MEMTVAVPTLANRGTLAQGAGTTKNLSSANFGGSTTHFRELHLVGRILCHKWTQK